MTNIIIPSGVKMDEKIETLQKVKVDAVNWVTYYLDQKNNEKWIKEYPHPEMQAGGPAQLRLIDKFPWE